MTLPTWWAVHNLHLSFHSGRLKLPLDTRNEVQQAELCVINSKCFHNIIETKPPPVDSFVNSITTSIAYNLDLFRDNLRYCCSHQQRKH